VLCLIAECWHWDKEAQELVLAEEIFLKSLHKEFLTSWEVINCSWRDLATSNSIFKGQRENIPPVQSIKLVAPGSRYIHRVRLLLETFESVDDGSNISLSTFQTTPSHSYNRDMDAAFF
jgi:hypothetical protein